MATKAKAKPSPARTQTLTAQNHQDALTIAGPRRQRRLRGCSSPGFGNLWLQSVWAIGPAK